MCRFVNAREINGWWLLLPCPSYDTSTRLPGFSDLLGMTFQLWLGPPSSSEAESRQWSFWDLTKCLVNCKVTHTGAVHKETLKPPDVFLLGSNKADVLDFARPCVIYFGFAIKKRYIYHVFGHFVLAVSRRIFLSSACKSNNIGNFSSNGCFSK